MTPELLVLDLDGTLVRLDVDWPALRRRLAAEARAHGYEPATRGVAALLRELEAAGSAEAAVACERMVRESEVDAVARSPVNLALLRWLDDAMAQTPLAVLSLNSRDAVAAALARMPLGKRRPQIAGREDVTMLKPHPQGLTRLIEAAGASPSHTLLVGDTVADHDCARAAGAHSIDVREIGVEWSF